MYRVFGRKCLWLSLPVFLIVVPACGPDKVAGPSGPSLRICRITVADVSSPEHPNRVFVFKECSP